MKTGVCILLIFLIVAVPALVPAAEGNQYGRKDPILAGALSWYVPGLGQFYAGSFLKGAAFWVVEEALLMSTLLTLAELELSVTGDIGLGVDIKSKENPDRSERNTAILLGSTLVVVHFINIIDAVNTTRKYNMRQKGRVMTDVSYDRDKESYRFSLKTPF